MLFRIISKMIDKKVSAAKIELQEEFDKKLEDRTSNLKMNIAKESNRLSHIIDKVNVRGRQTELTLEAFLQAVAKAATVHEDTDTPPEA